MEATKKKIRTGFELTEKLHGCPHGYRIVDIENNVFTYCKEEEVEKFFKKYCSKIEFVKEETK